MMQSLAKHAEAMEEFRRDLMSWSMSVWFACHDLKKAGKQHELELMEVRSKVLEKVVKDFDLAFPDVRKLEP